MNVMQMLQRVATASFAAYDPQDTIDVVNALLPLGKDRALAAIDSYLATQDLEVDPQEGLFLLLRVLFEVPPDKGYQPPMRLGGTSPPPPPAPESLPLFPLVLIDDVPLLIIAGYTLGGDAEPVTVHLRHFRETGHLRTQGLVPSESEDEMLDQFQAVYFRAYGGPPSPAVLARIESQSSKVHRG